MGDCNIHCPFTSDNNKYDVLINHLNREIEEIRQTTTAKSLSFQNKFNELCVYIKNNLSNELRVLFDAMKVSGELDNIITETLLQQVKAHDLKLLGVVSVEQFGAQGNGMCDDTKALLDAFAFCKENNVTLTSGGGVYYITKNIEIPNITVDFNYGTFKGNDRVISLNDTRIKNIRLYGVTLSTTGSNLIIDGVFFDKWKGTALNLNRGTYTHHVRNLYFAQPADVTDYTGNVGIEFNCSDTTVDGLEGHGFKTAVIVRGQNNGLINAQPWINRHSNYKGSVCIQLEDTNFFISNSILDTWEKLFVGNVDFLKCQLHNVTYIHNAEMCDHEHVTVFTKCSLFTGKLILKLSDFERKGCTCDIGGFTHVDVEIIDGKLTKPISLNKEALQACFPSIANGEYFIFDNSFIKVNNGKFSAHMTVSVQGTTAGGNMEIDISNIPNLNAIDVRGKALAVGVVNGATVPAWVYYQVNSAKRLVITLPSGVSGWWEFTINDTIDAPF